MNYCSVVQDIFFPAYLAVEKLIDHRPTVTMGAAVLLLANQRFTADHDLDLIVPANCGLFDGIEPTTSPCGTYYGYKRIMDIHGVKVEVLADFWVTTPGNPRIQLVEKQASLLVRDVRGTKYVPITSSSTLRGFYRAMNRPKDQPKIQLLEEALS